MELYSRGDVEVSELREVDRVKKTLELCRNVLNDDIDAINPEDNSLPIDALHWLISIEVDCKDLVKYLSDYNSYDPG
tara:strand:- start:530 stop:760 length:231 start_codon:yes stop_codon:yes gene_type:complete